VSAAVPGTTGHKLGPCQVPPGGHGARLDPPLEHDDLLDPVSAGLEGNVDDTLQVDSPALPPGDVACEQRLGPGQAEAVGERPGAEPGEDHRVDSADADDGQHQDDGLEGCRHVDRDAVAPPDPEAP